MNSGVRRLVRDHGHLVGMGLEPCKTWLQSRFCIFEMNRVEKHIGTPVCIWASLRSLEGNLFNMKVRGTRGYFQTC